MAHPFPTGILRPSSASRWGPDGCSGSFALEGLFPDLEDGPEAIEGTAGHYYVTEYLLGRAWPVRTITPNGHPIDQKMIEHGQLYIDDVRNTVATMGPDTLVRVETKVFPHALVHPENEGTPDTFAISLVQRRLVLWDYKYGHKYVEPFRFWQGINYIAGIFEGLGLTRDDVADMAISIRVIQPRNYHIDGPVRTWETTGAVIWEMIEQLRAAAYAAKVVGAPTRTGPHCVDCNGRHACEAFMKVAARAVDMAGETTPVVLPPAAVGAELSRIAQAIKRLEARRDGLHEQSLAIIAQGGRVPGWKKGFVDSREVWDVPVPQVVALGAALGIELAVPTAKTPAEARRLGIDPVVVAGFSRKPTGAAKLIAVDEQAEAAKVFAPPPTT